MDLLGVLLHKAEPSSARVVLHEGIRRCIALRKIERFFEQNEQFFRIKAARAGQDDVVGYIVPLLVAKQTLAGNAADALFGAEDRQCQRIPFKKIGWGIPLLLLSGAAMGFNWILLFEAYKYTSVSAATLSYYFAPIIVTVVCPFLFRS